MSTFSLLLRIGISTAIGALVSFFLGIVFGQSDDEPNGGCMGLGLLFAVVSVGCFLFAAWLY
jgi:hypothetical protein